MRNSPKNLVVTLAAAVGMVGCVVPKAAPVPIAPPPPVPMRPPEASSGTIGTTISLAWDYSDPSVTFNLYASSDLAHWQVATNTPYKFVTLPIEQPNLFYFVTATNAYGESPSPWNH